MFDKSDESDMDDDENDLDVDFDEDDVNDGLGFKFGVWIVLGPSLFLLLVVLVFWRLAKIL